MTDLHLRIGMVAKQRQQERTTTMPPTTPAAQRPPVAGAISNERHGGPKRTSRRPERAGAMRIRGAPGERALGVGLTRVPRSWLGAWVCITNECGFSAASSRGGSRTASRWSSSATQRPGLVCFQVVDDRLGGSGRSVDVFTSAHSRWCNSPLSRRSSRADWCSSQCSPSGSSAFTSGDDSGSALPSLRQGWQCSP